MSAPAPHQPELMARQDAFHFNVPRPSKTLDIIGKCLLNG